MDLPSGSYVGPGGPREVKGTPTLVGRAPQAADPRMAEAVWRLCARDTGTDLALRGIEGTARSDGP